MWKHVFRRLFLGCPTRQIELRSESMRPLQISEELLQEPEWQETLACACIQAMKEKKRGMLCLTGRPGSGKSTIGKQIRKNGLPGISPSRIAVIDDGVLSISWLGFLKRRVKHSVHTLDELAPFENHLRGKRLVVYVSSRPERRISACDIAVRVVCEEQERRRRLLARNKDGESRFQQSSLESDIISIPAVRYFKFHSH